MTGALAYEEQCHVFGGLPLDHERALKTALKRHCSADGNGKGKPSTSSDPTDSARSNLPFAIDTQFIRECQGREYVVTMTADGLEWNGEIYAPLSAVARAITGTRWNGHRFFGLTKQRKRAES